MGCSTEYHKDCAGSNEKRTIEWFYDQAAAHTNLLFLEENWVKEFRVKRVPKRKTSPGALFTTSKVEINEALVFRKENLEYFKVAGLCARDVSAEGSAVNLIHTSLRQHQRDGTAADYSLHSEGYNVQGIKGCNEPFHF